jgi:hypothetical protein
MLVVSILCVCVHVRSYVFALSPSIKLNFCDKSKGMFANSVSYQCFKTAQIFTQSDILIFVCRLSVRCLRGLWGAYKFSWVQSEGLTCCVSRFHGDECEYCCLLGWCDAPSGRY